MKSTDDELHQLVRLEQAQDAAAANLVEAFVEGVKVLRY